MTGQLTAGEQVVQAGQDLLRTGLTARTWGNLSIRLSPDAFLITPSGMDYREITPQRLVEVGVEDLSWQGPYKPSSEKGIHADVYRLRPEVNFVIHTHQDMASVIGVAGEDLTEDLDPILGEKVPCAGYGLPGTGTLRRSAAKAVASAPGCTAVLLRNHGALCMGRSREEAFAAAQALERTCRRRYEAAVGDLGVLTGPALGDSVRLGNKFHLVRDGEIRRFDLEDPRLTGAAALHAAIYRNNRRLGAIVHACRRPVAAVSAMGKTLYPLLDDLAQIAGVNVRCVPLGRKAALMGLRDRNAVLLRGAGALCTGVNLEDAQAVAMILKKGCEARLYADTIPGVRPLSPADAALQRVIYVRKYARMKTEAAWDEN